jgi:CHAD domain-containing protein
MDPADTDVEDHDLPDPGDAQDDVQEVQGLAPAVRPVARVLTEAGDKLCGACSLEVDQVRPWRRVWWDTADWRLLFHGLALELTAAAAGEQLVLHGVSSMPPICRVPQDLPAALRPEDLPEGKLRACLQEHLGLRALMPLAGCSGEIHRVRVLDRRRKTVVRLEITEPDPTQDPVPDPGPDGQGVRVLPVRGYEEQAEAVARALGEAERPVRAQVPSQRPAPADGAGQTELGQAEAAFRAAGLSPGVLPGAPAVPLGPATPAGPAVAATLLGLLDQIEAATDGTVKDVDTEFLHDLRVAVRRSRSVVKLAGDALPAGLPARFAPQLSWLADLTTPVRDLDVHLLLLPEYCERLVAFDPEDLAPLRTHLLRDRTRQRQILVRGLHSRRHARLRADWRAELQAVVGGHRDGQGTEEGPAALAFADLARERITRAERTVLRRGRRIDQGSPAERLHTLRKRCKELRYLIQLFEPALDPVQTRAVVGHLKKLQNVLGRFQDCEVQGEALRDQAEKMSQAAGSGTPTATLLAVGELAGSLAREQETARAAFAKRFAQFDTPEVRRRTARLVRSPGDAGPGEHGASRRGALR